MGTFKDSLKKWFYTQGTQAASSSARIPLLDASGNPIGSDTMANLASVLGATQLKTLERSSSLDSLTEDGMWYCGANQGQPTNCDFVFCKHIYTNRLVQFAFNSFSYVPEEIYYRRSNDYGSFVGKEWRKMGIGIPDFYKSYADLSSLANALGALSWIGITESESDIDNIEKSSISYYFNRIIVTFVNGVNTHYRAQFAMYDNGTLQYRNRKPDGWKEWKTISLT